MELTHLEDTFVDIGGQFYTSAFDLREKLGTIKAVILDWDGVFNDGRKGIDNSSNFSEIDSLGVSMLRFGYFLKNKTMLKTGIISGELNPISIHWANREHMNEVYTNCKKKLMALEHFCTSHNIQPSEVIYIYDDILDVPIAEQAGIRLAVGRLCNPLFMDYIEKNKLADYISSCQGNEHAVREFCELILCLMDKHFEVIDERAAYSPAYEDYLNERNTFVTNVYEIKGREIMHTGQ